MEHKKNKNYAVSCTASAGAGFFPAADSAMYNVQHVKHVHLSVAGSVEDVAVPASDNQLRARSIKRTGDEWKMVKLGADDRGLCVRGFIVKTVQKNSETGRIGLLICA